MLGIDLDGYSSKYGSVYVVNANPATEGNGHYYSYNPDPGEDTEYFMYAKDARLKMQLDEIGYSIELWSPKPEDFIDETSLNKESGQIRVIHVHHSLWKRGPSQEIRPQMEVSIPHGKRDELLSQYHEKKSQGINCGNDFRDYVTIMAIENKDNFYGWLFEDESLSRYQHLPDLPLEYLTKLQVFLESCDNYF